MKEKGKIIAAAIVAASLQVGGQAEAAIDYNDFLNMVQNEHIGVSYYEDGQINYEKSDPTDAITTVDFSTKSGVNRKLTGIATNANDNTSAATVGYVAAASADLRAYADDNLNKAKDYTDSKFEEGKGYSDSVGAMSAAMASIPAPIHGGKGQTSWGIGVGNFHSKTAVAAGISHDISDNVRAQIKAATYNGQSMLGVGLGGSFGSTPETKVNNKGMDELRNRLDRLEAQNRALAAENSRLTSIRTSTNNYTNMYGHNFVVKRENGEPTLYNLDGTKFTEEQYRKLAEDFVYNNGHEFDYTGFQINPNGNWQYRDPETGQWLGGSEQSAVGEETITIEKSERINLPKEEKNVSSEVKAPSSGGVDFDEIERQIREEAKK